MDMKLSRWKRCYSAPTFKILNTSRQTQIHKVVIKGFENSYLYSLVLRQSLHLKVNSIPHLKSGGLGLHTSWLSPFQDKPPIMAAALLQAVDFWHGEIQPTYYMGLFFWYGEILTSSFSDMEKYNRPTTWGCFFGMERFWHLVWAHLMSCNFSLFSFLFLCTFSKCMVCLLIKFCRDSSNSTLKYNRLYIWSLTYNILEMILLL